MPDVDLHTHTTYSDGKLSPQELLQAAKAAGLSALALTDHDTTDGLPEAVAEGAKLGIRVVAGVEISADYAPGTMHILGLGVDPAEPAFAEALRGLQRARAERNPRMLAALQAQGLELSWQDVQHEAGGPQVGRPHFAAALIAKGLVKDFDEAFDRWLGKGCPAYVPKVRLAPDKAIACIHAAGGVAVLAHPIQLRLEGKSLEEQIARLKSYGLDGIEVWHTDHDAAWTKLAEDLAQRHGLKASGGSDFHGIPGRAASLGRPQVPASVLDALLAGRA